MKGNLNEAHLPVRSSNNGAIGATRELFVSPLKYISNRCSDTISLHSQSGSTLRTQQADRPSVAVSGSPYLLGQT